MTNKKVTMSADVVFSLKIPVKVKKKSSLFVMRPHIFSEAPHFLRGPRLQPAKPTRKSGSGHSVTSTLHCC